MEHLSQSNQILTLLLARITSMRPVDQASQFWPKKGLLEQFCRRRRQFSDLESRNLFFWPLLLNRQGGYTEGFPPFLVTFGWTIFTPWAKTWNIRISKIDQKSTCWFWDLEVSLDFPDTLKSTGGLYWGVSTIFSHFWLNYFYAVGKNLKNQDLKNQLKINQHVDFDT